eukprot:114216-Amphidinium_carterae.1
MCCQSAQMCKRPQLPRLDARLDEAGQKVGIKFNMDRKIYETMEVLFSQSLVLSRLMEQGL